MFFALQCASALVRMPVRLPRICRKAGTEDSWKDMMLSFVVVMISVTHHCERSEAIRLSLCRRMDCFASLAMTVVVRGYSLSHRRRACGRRLRARRAAYACQQFGGRPGIGGQAVFDLHCFHGASTLLAHHAVDLADIEACAHQE